MAWICLRCSQTAVDARSGHLACFGRSRAAFTTSATNNVSPSIPRLALPNVPVRGSRMTYSPKDKRPRVHMKSKPPEPGERKAMRKRILTSNANALDVPGIADLNQQNVSLAATESKVMGIPAGVVERLRAVGAFKPTQGWRYFKRPCTLVRKETLELARKFDDVALRGPRATRSIVVGERGSGKSAHLLQAMTLAMLRDWVVINFPEAQDLTNAHTEYALLPGSSPAVYIQRMYTADLLTRISAANPILRSLQVTQEHDLPTPIPPKASLARLCSIGADPSLAQAVFEALTSELSAPGRPPLLISLDGLFHAMRFSDYKSASFESIHAHSLYLIGWFLGYLSARSPLPNGGAVIAAVSESNCPSVPTLRARLEQLEAQQTQSRRVPSDRSDSSIMPFLQATAQELTLIPRLDPHYLYDTRVLDTLSPRSSDTRVKYSSLDSDRNGSYVSPPDVVRLGALPMEEARSIMEYWAQSGMMRNTVHGKIMAEKQMISGGGLIGHLEKGCVTMNV